MRPLPAAISIVFVLVAVAMILFLPTDPGVPLQAGEYLIEPVKHAHVRPSHRVTRKTKSSNTKQRSLPKTIAGYERHIARSSASLKHVTPKLAARANKLIAQCGAKVTSGYRPGARVRGSGRASLHSRYPAQAVDMQGNPRCMYAIMKRQRWPGGYSVDYSAVRHIHISLASDGRERGARFVHYGSRSRYAKAARYRMASRW